MKQFALAAIVAISQAQDEEKKVLDENKGDVMLLPNAVSSGV